MEGIPYFYGILTWSTFGTFSASRRSVLSHFSEVRGKTETAEHNRFFATKPQVAEAQNRDLVGRSRFFPHFRNRLPEVCGKFRKPRVHRPFRVEKPQVEALRHLGVLGKF